MSEPVLNQEEVSALLCTVAPREKANALLATLPPMPQPRQVESFGFGENRIAGPENYPMFSNLHQQPLVELIIERWQGVFRRETPVFFKEMIEQSYLDILDSDVPRIYFTLEASASGSMLAVLDMQLAVSYIDAMLGGSGDISDREDVSLTVVEHRLAARIAESIGHILTRLWRPVRHIQFTPGRMDTDPMALALTAEDINCFSVSYVIVLGEDVRGELSVHYPLSFLEPMIDAMRSQERAKPKIADRQWARELRLAIDQVPLQIRLEMGHCQMYVKDFMYMKPGDMLPLTVAENEPAIVWIENLPAFQARPGAQDGMLAAEILDPVSNPCPVS